MGRRAVVCAMVVAAVGVVATGCDRTADRLARGADEPDPRAVAPSTPGCLDAWNETAPAAYREELVRDGFADVSMSTWIEQAAGTDDGSILPLTGCSYLARRGDVYRTYTVDWDGEGYRWPADRGRGEGPWGDFQEHRFLRSHVVTADGSLRAVQPGERGTADCIAAWNSGSEAATYDRLRRRPYTRATVAIRAAAIATPDDVGCALGFDGPGLPPLEVTGSWQQGVLVWQDERTGHRPAGRANARVLGDASLMADGAVPKLIPPRLGAHLVVGTRRVLLTDSRSGCVDRQLETNRRTGRIVLPYVGTRTRVTWWPEGGRRRVIATRRGRHGELVVPLHRGTGALRAETWAAGRELGYVVCLDVSSR